MLKSIIIFLLFTLSFSNCTRYYFKEFKQVIPDLEAFDKKKVALVGFYHFFTYENGNMRYAEIDYKNSAKDQLRFGTPVNQIPFTEIDT